MAALDNVVLPKKLHKELINITKKEDTVDAIKELINREIARKKNKYMFIVKNFEKKYKMKLWRQVFPPAAAVRRKLLTAQ